MKKKIPQQTYDERLHEQLSAIAGLLGIRHKRRPGPAIVKVLQRDRKVGK
jgi:hypothetical protein